jgi:hypothetical protein
MNLKIIEKNHQTELVFFIDFASQSKTRIVSDVDANIYFL